MTAPDKRIFYLVSDSAKTRASQAINDPIYAGFKVSIMPPAKTRPQEERYHAMIGDIARTFTLHGRLWDSESMKRLLVDQFHRDTKNDPDLKQEWLDMGHIEAQLQQEAGGRVHRVAVRLRCGERDRVV